MNVPEIRALESMYQVVFFDALRVKFWKRV